MRELTEAEKTKARPESKVRKWIAEERRLHAAKVEKEVAKYKVNQQEILIAIFKEVIFKEVDEFIEKEKDFQATPIGAAFNKFKNKLIRSCAQEAQIEYQDYTDQGYASVKRARKEAREAEKEFRELLNQYIPIRKANR